MKRKPLLLAAMALAASLALTACGPHLATIGTGTLVDFLTVGHRHAETK